MRRIVVVGNGIAGLTACDTLRALGFDGELTVVGGERHAAYSRPALSKALLNGGDVSAHELPAPTHGARELLGVRATGLDAAARIVRLDDGQALPYDGLVIASGSSARRLPESDPEAAEGEEGQLTLRTLDDAIALTRRLAERPAVIVVGGGPLGMEVASGCLRAGCEVTLVSGAPPLSRHLGDHLSGVFVAAARDRALRIVPGEATGLVTGSWGSRVLLRDGGRLEADLVVTAIGDRPDTGWLADSTLAGAPHADGAPLRVDSRGRLRPGIVAAGDVASFPAGRGHRRVPLWTSAGDQARTAAAALLLGDGAAELDHQPYFWTEGFGLSLKAAGALPVSGPPDIVEEGEGPGSGLWRWRNGDGTGTAVALNHRVPVPRLRRLARAGGEPAAAAAAG